MAELWMPGATQIHGHPDKVGYGSNVRGPKRGDVKHSAEGWARELKRLVQDINRRASWHFSVLVDGEIWQHYPIDAHCWHSGDTDDDGGVKGNLDLVGIEHEGLAGTPLTAAQTFATAEISRFCAAYWERDTVYTRYPIMPTDGWTLAEHNQISDKPTACPSGRIPWDDILALLNTEETEPMQILIRETSSQFVFILSGVWYSYLHRMADATALGISTDVVVVPDGTLRSYVRAD